MILTFGEIISKSIATRHAAFIVLRSAKLLFVLQLTMFLTIWLFEQFSKIMTPNNDSQ
jgi:CBS domain containing-hemolysin-like protein